MPKRCRASLATALHMVVKNSQKLDRFFTAVKSDRGGMVGFGLTRFDWVGLSWTDPTVGLLGPVGRVEQGFLDDADQNFLSSGSVFMPAKVDRLEGQKWDHTR